MKLLFTSCFLLLLILNGGVHHAEGRRHRERRSNNDYMLLVFGDSFVDAGNLPRTSEKTVMSRAWFYPYGISDSAHGNRPTGRVSDGMVQSDILAKILGGDESPPPSRLQRANRVDPSGVNFAVAGSGVFDDGEPTSLRRQVDQLASLVNSGIVEARDLEQSAALVAVSAGHDYSGLITQETSSNQVADEIAAAVRQLQDLGVSKVMVNLLPALGCMPWLSVSSNYTNCDRQGNMVASMHNTALRRNLDSSPDVLLLDLYSIFTNSVQPSTGPCCKNPDPNGYCGQEDRSGRAHFSICANPSRVFFWDYIHPSQAGWETIMEQLEGPIEDFLGIESSW